MPHILHLLKPDTCQTALSVIEHQSRQPDAAVTVILLHGASAPALPDGVTVRRLANETGEGDLTPSDLLDLIFTADSVVAW